MQLFIGIAITGAQTFLSIAVTVENFERGNWVVLKGSLLLTMEHCPARVLKRCLMIMLRIATPTIA